MADANLTELPSRSNTQGVRNPLVGFCAADTAMKVRSVLRYLASVQPTGNAGLDDDEENGRFMILQSCIAALGTIGEAN